MDLQYYGANCVALANRNVRLVVDDNLSELGAKTVLKPQEVALFTGSHRSPTIETKLIVDGPGEYEISGLSIVGIPARGHMDTEGTHFATMYKIQTDDTTCLVTGHIYPALTDEQLEAIGIIDVLIVPVGGNGFTLDPIGALQLIKKIEPKVVIPTHYADETLEYPVTQLTLEDALKGLGMEQKDTVAKYRYKPQELLGTTQLVILSRA